MLTVEELRRCTRQALVLAGPAAGVALAVAGHAGELVVVQVGSGRALGVTGHATQQGVWVQHQAPLTLGTLVGLRPGAPRTCLVAL